MEEEFNKVCYWNGDIEVPKFYYKVPEETVVGLRLVMLTWKVIIEPSNKNETQLKRVNKELNKLLGNIKKTFK